jgi:hypothetical protein
VVTCDRIVAVHGRGGKERQSVEVGGAGHGPSRLFAVGCRTQGSPPRSSRAAAWRPESREHLQQGSTSARVQLEITRGLREVLLVRPQGLADFAHAVRRAIP